MSVRFLAPNGKGNFDMKVSPKGKIIFGRRFAEKHQLVDQKIIIGVDDSTGSRKNHAYIGKSESGNIVRLYGNGNPTATYGAVAEFFPNGTKKAIKFEYVGDVRENGIRLMLFRALKAA